jgi:hypothetical protein
MSEQRKGFALRISPDLYEDLRTWADSELRSVNGQIELLLRQAVQQRKGFSQTNTGKPGKKRAS